MRAVTVINTNVTYDVSAPVITATAPATGSYVKDTKVSYTLSEAALSGSITWTQTGGTADPASPQVMSLTGAELNSGAHASITITNAPTLVDGAIYSIAYNVTDLAGNTGVTVTNTNITYDVTLPVISATTPATGSYVKDTKVSYTLSEPALSGTITWTRTGGSADGTIHTQAFAGAELNSGAHANIILTNAPTLVDGSVYSISYDVTDLAGNAAVTVTNTSITYDVSAPVVSATAPATGSYVKDTKVSYTISETALSGTITWTQTGGTADPASPQVMSLAGAELNSGAHANIVLTNAPTLVDGAIYSISYDVIDLSSNASVTVTNTNITYDVTLPVISATTPATGSFVKDTKVSYTLSEPALTGTITWTQTGGTADPASPQVMALTGVELNSGAHASITLTNAPTLVDGAVYSIAYNVNDLAGNAAVAITNTSITYDVTLPEISATAPATGSYVKDTKVSYTLSEPALSGTITWTQTGGTPDPASPQVMSLTGAELNSGAHAFITLTNAPTLVDGAIYSIAYNVTDLAGNASVTVTNTSVTYDVALPVVSATTPATGSYVKDTKVSYTLSELALSGTISWTRTGGTADGAIHAQALAGAELNVGVHANITLTNAPTLVDGAIYSIAYDVTDLAGNASVTVTNTNVTYDVTLPVISATTPATGSFVKDTKVSYTLSEPALSGTITWTQTSGTVDPASPQVMSLAGAELNLGAHANITITNAPTLVDGAIYSISYDVTDLAGNASVTVTNTNVTYDVLAPVIIATAPSTDSYVKDTKVSYTLSEAALSGSITWTQTGGTADPASPQVMSLTGAELNSGAHASITLTNAPTLVDGAIYSIAYNVFDLAGNAAVTVTNTNITYDVTLPVISATTPATGSFVKDTKVSYTLSEPALSGTITWTRTGGSADGTIHTQALAGAELNSGAHANITLTNAPTLVDGAVYSIAYDVTDLAGNAAVTVTNTSITYDVSAPVVSATAPATGSYVKDTKVSYTISEPALSGTITWTQTGGTADPASPQVMSLVGAELNSGAHANITLTNAPALVDGAIYSISYDVIDLSGNASVTVTNTNVTYDVTLPVISATTPATGSFVKDTKVSYTLSEPALSGTITWTQTGGTADPASPQVMALTGAELNSGAHANITLTNAPTLVDGAVYSIAYNVNDLAGNAAVTITNTSVTYDVTLPVISATTPATGSYVKDTKVSYTLSEPALSGTITWTQTGGTPDPASPQVMSLTGAELNSGAHAFITLTNAPTLVDGAIYSIAYNVTDLAGNASVTVTNTSVTYDVTLPVVSATAPATGSFVKDTKVSYTLSEPALSGTITWTRTGGTADGAIHTQALAGAELNSGAHAAITLTNAPTLVDGAIYSIAYDVTDLAGNASATVTNTNVTYDVTLPVISATTPATGSFVKDTKVSYTLSEPALSGTITWTQTSGTADPASPQVMSLTGAELNLGAHANITITNAPTLVDGAVYSVSYDVIDLAGNAAVTVTNTNITYDVSAPVISATAPATGSYVKDTKVSYTLSEAALSGLITWTQTGGTADPASPQVMSLTGAELNSGAHASITLTNAPTLVDGAIYSIAYNVFDLAGNAAVTVTNTNITYDVTLPVISATTPATGSFVKDTKVSYTLSEPALSGTITWTRTGGTADGTIHTQALAGAELNSGAHANITLTNAPTLVDGAVYSIAYDVIDLAGNAAITVTNTNITYDVSAPVVSATAPATGSYIKDTKVSYTLSEPALSGTITWTQTGGTADPASPQVKALAGAELNSGAHTNITLANAPTLVDGAIYSISYDVLDLSSNASVTVTNTNITYDVTLPVISSTTPATGSFVKDTKVSYTLSEPALTGTITWTQTGGTADPASPQIMALTGSELNSGAHANITLTNAPTLVDGSVYLIAYNVNDLAGNAAVAITNTSITYDVTLPVISATTPATGSFVKDTKVSYTLSEPALSGTVTWMQTGGTADPASPQVMSLTGAELNSGAHASITLTNAPTLVDGAVYSIAYSVTDLAGNASVTVTNTSVTYDVTLPVISATAPATGSYVKDTKVSYTLSEPALSGTITWTRTGGTADGAIHTQALAGAELNSGAHAAITLTNAPTLVDGAIYSIAYDVTDLAGNASVTVTNTNVTYDVTLPVISATAPATGSFVKDTKVSYTLSEPALSGTITWTQTSGTADPASPQVMSLAGAELNSGAHAAIILINAPTLVDGAIYSISYDVTDLAGNAAVTVTNTNVTYDVLAPVITATAPATGSYVKDTKVSYTLSEAALSGSITWTQTGGTADPASPQVMSLAGAELNSGAHASITLTNAPTLVDGAIYSIAYNVFDLAGNAAVTVTNTNITYDVTLPVISATTPATGSFVKDTKVSYTLSEPALSGTITWTRTGGSADGTIHTQAFAGAELNSGAHANIILTNAPTLVDGSVYSIAYDVTDLAGNNAITITNTSITYDVSAPVVSATAPSTGSYVKDTKVSYTISEPALSGTITWTQTGGTADPASPQVMSLAGAELNSGAHANITLTNAPALVDGAIYSISYDVIDLSGNASVTVTNTNVTYDVTLPVISATTPATGSFVKDTKVSYTLSEPALSGTITWTQTGGTADPASPQVMALTGAELNSGAHASITLTNAPTLVDGAVYSIAYNVNDLAGNAAVTITNTSVTYDVTLPVISATTPATGSFVKDTKVSYTLSEPALSGTITWTQTGGTADPASPQVMSLTGAELNSGAHASITLTNAPTLVDGAIYSIAYNVTDLAGNASVTVTNTNVTYDVTLPVISATAPATGSYVKDTKVSYTLSEPALSGTITWTRTGGTADGAIHTQALAGAELNSGAHAAITLTNAPTLVDGAIYSIAYDVTDLAGNASVTVTNTNVTYDVTLPVISATAPATGSFVKDTKVSYTLSEPALSGTITWTQTSGTADPASPQVMSLAGAELNSGAHAAIILINAPTLVDGAIYSISYDVTDLAGNASVTVINTNVTYDVSAPVITATAPATGSYVKDTKVSYTLSEAALSGSITWTQTGGTADPASPQVMSLTGAELNSGAHVSITLTNAPTLVDGAIYSIAYNVTDLAGNTGVTVTNTNITYDVTLPVISATTPATGSYVKDTKVSYTLSEPALSGTITWTRTGGSADGTIHTQAFAGAELNSGAHANIILTNAPTLVDGSVYSIAYDVTDLAGNVAVTVTNTSITYDVSAPVVSATAPATGAYVKDTKVSYTLSEPALSGTITWTQTGGTADPASPQVMSLAGAELNSGAHANIVLTNAPTLVDGAIYSISYDVVDLSSNASVTVTNTNITYDVTLPVISATTPATGSFVKDTKVSYTLSEPALSGTITWTQTGGTADPASPQVMALTGAELNSGAHANITLTNAPTLVDGAVYSIAYNVNDLAGNAAVTITNTSVTYDVTLPVISATTPATGSFVKDTKVSYTLSEPALSGTITWTQTGGTADPASPQVMSLTGAELNSGAHASITLTNAPTLVDGAIYSIAYNVTDLAGNASVTVTNTSVTYDVTLPVISATAPATGSYVKDTKVSYTLSEPALSGTITWTRTGGTADGAIHTQALAGAELNSGAHAAITLMNAPTLVDGAIYSIAYDVTDLAGNASVTVTNTNVTYDVTLPVISATTPATGSFVKDTKVSYTLSEPALSGTITWTQTSGTVDPASPQVMSLAGAELNSGAHAAIILINAPTLVDGAIYSISYDVTDLAGNAAVTVINTNVTYDVSAPVITATAPATGSYVKDTKVSYTLSEAALSGSITWTQTGGTADPASPQVMSLTGAELNSGAHASITLTNAPTLVDGAIYSIAYSVTDLAANTGVTITNTNITYDVTLPVISATTPATGSYVKDTKVSYTLSEPALSGTISWTRTGGSVDGTIHTQALAGAELNSGAHANITLTNAPTLVDGAVYSIAYDVIDLAGNAAITVTNTNITYDVSAPVVSATAPATGAYVKDTKVSYTLSEPALSGTITWTQTGGTADPASPQVMALTGAELNSGAHANIILTNAPTLVDGAIYSISYDVIDLSGNASVTVTNTNVTYDVTLPVISATTPATGSFVKDTKVSYTLSEPALSGTITWTQTGGTADPASPQVMALTGAELNSGAHANITLTNAPTLVDGSVYSIAYNVNDLAGNAAVAITNTSIIYDVTLPVISATAPATGSYVKDTKVSYTLSEPVLSGTITWTQTGGTADPASPQVMALAGAELNSGAHASITLTNAPTLVDGAVYSIAYSVTDLAGNASVTVTNTNVTYDVTLPVISATAPATGSYVKDTKVSYTLSESALSGTITWTRTGGTADGAIHTQALAGAELNVGAHANITLTNAPTLVDGAIYSIAYDVTDLAGNTSVTVTNTNVTYDVTLPVISETTPATGSYVKDTKVSYTLSEPALSGTITWTQTSGTVDPASPQVMSLAGAELNLGAHANITITNAPTLVDGAIYSISYDVTDLAGNAAVTVINTNLTYDVSAPVITATAPATGSYVKDTKVSYTLSEAALSGSITWTQTGGTADPASPQVMSLTGAELNSGAHASITITNAPTLVDGAIYSIAYNVTDLAGNTGVTVTNTNITYDVTLPVISATTPATGSYVKDTKVSYTLSEPALSGAITWTRTGGTADGTIHTQALAGAELNSGAHANITLTNAPTLVDGSVYSIAYDVTDLAGNNAITITNTSITYDVSAPVVSATAPSTGSYIKDTKVSYTLSEPALTGTITWTQTGGTADPASPQVMALTGAELNSGAHANIILTNAPTLVDGAIYSISYDVIDLSSNASVTVTNTNVTYDVTLPVISATTPATGSFVKDTKVSYTLSEPALSGTITWTQTGGTADPASPQVMALTGAELNSGAHANITLTNAPTLVDGSVYSIAYNVNDLAGNAAVAITNTSIIYDVTLPVISATAPATGSYVKDTKVSYTLSEPVLSGTITWTQTGGTADPASPQVMALAGAELNSGAHAFITLTNAPTLVDGAVYSIAYSVTDLAGNASVTVTNTSVTYDVTLPVVSATAPATGSYVKDTKVSYTLSEPALSGTITWTRTGGTADGAIHAQALAGAELNSGAHAAIILTNAPTLVDGAIYSIAYDVLDLAGNASATVTNTNVTYDVTLPVISETTPATGSYVKDTKVSYTLSEPALSGTITWTQTSGTVDPASPQVMSLAGAELNLGAHANITITNAPTLVDGAIYSISYDVTDLAGNAAVTVINTNVTYDVSAPVITATAPATGSYVKDTKVSYTLSEAALSGSITWTQTGGTADPASPQVMSLTGAELNSGAHASITLTNAPTLVDGAIYSIAYNVTDLAGNTGVTVTNTNITYDVTLPVISATTPATGSYVKDTKVSYTLSEPALSGAITWTRTGGTADGTIHTQALAGAELNSGAHANITLTNAPTLVDGSVYSIAYDVTDLAGNNAITITNTSITYDVSAPVVSATAPSTGSYIKDTKVSYTLSEPALTGTITWTQTGGTADPASPQVMALTGAELNSGAHANIILTNAPTLVDGAIYSISYDVIDLSSNASVTVTNTNVTYDVTLPVISATTPATGSFVKDTKVSYTLSEPALSGTITWTQTGGTADPASPQVMALTGAELNSGAHANITLTNAPTLVDGSVYSIAYNVNDLAGNAAVAITNTSIIYDVTLPVISATAPATGSYVKDTKVSYTLSEPVLSGTITWTQTGGTADPASPQVMALAGAELNSGAHAFITLTNAPTLVDGAVYSIAYSVTDLAGNASVTVTNTSVTYDVTLPVVSATAPATGSYVKDTKVSYTLSEPALSGTITWTRTGGTADGTIHTQALAGAELNSGAHAAITLTNAPTLVDGAIYSIAYDVTDLAGNASVTVTNTNVTYDVTLPVISASAPATGSFVKDTKVSYTLSELALSGTITWMQTSGTVDPASPQVMSLAGAELNSGAHAAIILINAPTLVDGAIYSISYDVIDLAGNAAVTVTNTNITYDVSAPVITFTAPATGSYVKDTKVSYTLSEAALSGSITWTQTGGTADPASPQMMSLTGAELNSGAHASITLTNAPILVDGAIYSIAFNVTDLAGNTGVTVTNTNINYDVTLPVISATTPATGSFVKDTKVSYTLSEPALSGTITWTRTGGTADGTIHTQALTGAELNAGVHTDIVLVNAPVLVNGTIYSISYDVTDLAGNAAITVTNTNITFDIATQTPILALPASSSFHNSTMVVDFTLPEAAKSGTVKMTFTQTGGAADANAPHLITFVAGFEPSGNHTTTLNGADLSANANVVSVNSDPNDALVDGAMYSVSIEYQDLAGNVAASATNSNMTYDITLPVITATSPATGAFVKDTKMSYTLSEPALSGTVTWTRTGGVVDGAVHIQSLAGAELNTGAHANITLVNAPTLVDGAVYSIVYDVTDLAGNNAVTVTNTNITYDVSVPVITATTPVPGSYVKDTKVSYTLSEPALSGTITWTQTGGTADPASPQIMALAGAELNSGAHAFITLTNAPTLVDGAIYSISYDATDLSGNAAVTVTNTNVTYDVTLPAITATTPITGSNVKDTKVSYTLSEPALSGTITWTRTGGTADGTIHTQTLTGAELNSGAHTNITLTNAPALVDAAIYSVSYDVTDLAGNAAITVTNNSITYDITLPAITATLPVTGSYVKDTKVSYTLSEAALSGTITWTQTSGTADPASPQVMTLTGAELNTGAHAAITLANAPTLIDGAIYSIAYDATDLAGNAAVTVVNTSVTYDVSAPVISATAPLTGSYVKDTKVSYTLSEAVLSGTVTWTQTGGTADPASPQIMALTGAELNSGAHTAMTLTNAPALVDGAIYSITYNVTDFAGNAAVAVTNTNVTYDVTLPVVSATAPVTGSYIKDSKVSFTLSEPALAGTVTWTRTGGTADPASPQVMALSGAELNSGAHVAITLTNAPVLVDGTVYSIAYDVTDLAGNAAVTITNTNIAYDVSAPVITATTPATGAYVKDAKVSYTLSEAALSGSITWTRTGGTADPASPQVMALSGAELNSGAHSNIILTNSPTLVDGAIYSISYDATDFAANVAVQVTNTNITYDVTLPVISATTPATGSYVKDTKVSYTLSEPALSGTITWTRTSGAVDGTIHTQTLTGAEQNSGVHTNITLANAPALVDGAIYSIDYDVIDLAGNAAVTITNTNITYDASLPVITATAPATGSYVKDTKVSYTLSEVALSGTITWTQTSGTVDPASPQIMSLTGAELTSGAHSAITLINAPSLVDGAIYSIDYNAIDLAGNAAVTVTNTNVTYDVTLPVISATAPVTGTFVKDTKISYTLSEPALSGTITWTRTGGAPDGAIHAQALTGAELNSGAHANITLINAPALVDGAIYSITYDVTDLAGNAALSVTNTNITYDVSAPVISATAPATGSYIKDAKVSYTLSEAAVSGTITWTQTGGTADPASPQVKVLAGAELNSGIHAGIAITDAPTLVDGAIYSVSYDVSDLAGNASVTVTNTNITYDVSAPVISATAPATDSYVKDTKVSYTLSEPALSGTITWTRTGGSIDGTVHTQALTGAELNFGAHAGITLTNAPTLVDGAIYSIAYDVTDLSGNAAVTITNTNVTYDITIPVISGTTPTTGSFIKDTKVSYTLSEAALSGTITWTQTNGTD